MRYTQTTMIPKGKERALQKLNDERVTVVLPADKGGVTVITYKVKITLARLICNILS